ncbi:MAG: hypothetical protein J5629_10885 [Muribaculaceae bacterium]|nr:hypothetical protein [Muribaculaceae bacterium]
MSYPLTLVKRANGERNKRQGGGIDNLQLLLASGGPLFRAQPMGSPSATIT